MLKRYTYIAFFTASVLLVSMVAVAATSQTPTILKLPDVEILDAQFHEYSVNEPFIVNLNKEMLLKAGGIDNLRFRLFAGSFEDLKKGKGAVTRDDCILFYSVTYKPKQYNGGVQFPVTFSTKWLGLDDNKEIKSQAYVLVLEEKNASVDDGILKLHPEQVSSYFSKGYQFIVKIPENLNADLRGDIVKYKKSRMKNVRVELTALASNQQVVDECGSFVTLMSTKLFQAKKTAYVC